MLKRVLATIAVVVLSVLLIAGVGVLIYYQSLKDSPQYSLALLVDAAKRDDKNAIDEFVDINAVVDDFVPQITDKAIELYGRGLPQATLARAAKLAIPILPAVKDRARAELPRVIRDRTERFRYVPFFGMVLGADRYLEITISGDTAFVKSKLPEHEFEARMRRNGDRWKIVGVKDEQLATDIARTIGQQIIAIASNGLTRDTADTLGVGNLADLLRQAEQLVK
ncbi:MAG: hypothetical protein WBO10_05900 [Pyrinomonadaceae bacterium]